MVVVSETRILSHVRGITDGPGEAPPLETSSCRIGFSILWGPVVVRMPRILRGVSEGPYGAWGAPPLETSCCRIGCSISWGRWL